MNRALSTILASLLLVTGSSADYIGDVKPLGQAPDSKYYPFSVTAPVTATATLTSDNTNVSNNDTVTVGGKTYTFKTTLTPTEGQVLIGADADASLLNLIRAINHSGTPGTDYKVNMPNTQVTAASSVTSHAFAVTAITPTYEGALGNLIATTENSTHLSWSGTTLTGGIYGSLNVTMTAAVAGSATAAKQDTGNASLASIDGKTPANAARTPTTTANTASGTIAAGCYSLTFIASSDFAGTILTNLPLPAGASITIPVQKGDTLGAVAFTRSAGTLYTVETR